NGACLPDPFISALLNGVTTVGMTDHLADTSTPTWTNGSFPVTLDANDSLEFAAWNWDPVLPALRMFTCVPDLDDIPTGKLHCSPRLEPGPDGPYGIDATIRKAP
ncbi:MAG TPA: C2 domain-containing protein, partial [Polyangiales bacterium]|nr:C2 domain-containing protein [Polyangiales bacterium]